MSQFSVVIPVFNHAAYVVEAVASALRSPLVAEVLVMDDGSSDASAAVIEQLSRAMPGKIRDYTIYPGHNQGAHTCLNYLVSRASCEWVAVLNSDDVLFPGRFEALAARTRHSRADFLFGHLSVIDAAGNSLGVKRAALDPEYPFPRAFDVAAMIGDGKWLPLLGHQNFIATTSNMVFRKTLFDRVGGFRPYRYVHDWDFAMRACILGSPLYIPLCLATYRLHGSNTIAEDRSRVEAEVGDLFEQLTADFPALLRDALFKIALSENRYMMPFRERAIAGVGNGALHLRSHGMTVADDLRQTPGYAELVYAPEGPQPALGIRDLENVLLAAAHQQLDFIIVSRSLKALPHVGCDQLRDVLLARPDIYAAIAAGEPPPSPAVGRVLRLFPSDDVPVRDLSELFCGATPVFNGAEVRLAGATAAAQRLTLAHDILASRATKPVVFVLPAFLAVGGVEKLAIEIMRQLSSVYDFVVVNWERLDECQGSLHAAAAPYILNCYELAEAGPPATFLSMLSVLERTYKPRLVWICNGSPWLADNAMAVRRVFSRVPIVDQQVYDTVQGWIARYHEPGIQSFDRFVAVNSKIAEVFTNRLRMDPGKIDLIYHPISDTLMDIRAADSNAIARKYGIPTGGPVIAFIGRLAPQKRPLLFLELARRAQQSGPRATFLLVGDGPLAEESAAFIARHQIENVIRIPYVPSVPELYCAVDCLAVTSEYEGLPLVLLDAMAMGVPAFSADVGDVGCVLQEYGSGLIVRDVNSIDAYFEAYVRCVEQLAELKAEAHRRAARVRERFSGQTVAAEYLACFERAIHSHANSGSTEPSTCKLSS